MKNFCTASFEVKINNQIVHSKLETNSFPDFNEVVQIVQDVDEGGAPRQVTKTKSAGCSIM
jgi:selenoprotein W-related protein